MRNQDNPLVWDWRRSIVDALIGAAAIAVAFAATGVTEQILYMLLIAGALVGIGLMLEPNPASDIAPQPLRPPAEPKLVRAAPPAMARLDAVIVEATSV